MTMEGSVRSGGVLKKKTSSGCLIFRPKGDKNNSGGRLGALSVNGKEKKRPRLVANDYSSSEEDESAEFMRRKVNDKRLPNGSGGYKRNEHENRNNVGIEISGERKRNRLDLFDEYDEIAGKKMKKQYAEDRLNIVGRSGGGSLKEYGVESSNRNSVVDKHKQGSYFDRSSNEMANQPIRLQGKNGVLKVMVNHKKNMAVPSQHKNIDLRQSNGRISIPMPFHPSGLKPPEKQGSSVFKEKTVEKQKKEIKLEKLKPLVSKKHRAEMALKKMVVEEERSSEAENATTAKGKESKDSKAKRVGNTEKQMLREKIRGMLIDAGWTIDYRPRRNREYLDAVYINPNGTAYWSIIKAYEAFKKHSEEENDKIKSDLGSPSFVPDDLVNKLTRQTKKKIAEEMKRKSIEAGMTMKSAVKGNLSEAKSRKVRGEKYAEVSNSGNLQGRTSKIIGRCTLLVRGSSQNSECDGYVPYSGKRTLLAWLIDSGTAQLSEKVQYMNRKRTQVMLEGWITRDGIHCGCCSKILTVSKFELHAGSKLRQPFHNIFLESGASMLQCQIDAWNKQEESVRRDFHIVDADRDDADDDTCGICADGGDLICCDSCPSTFHQTCLEIQMLPSGDWHCPNCTCKFCGNASVEVAEESENTIYEITRCSFCEKKYHKSCSEEVDTLPMTSNGVYFCGLKCQELYEHLQKILGVRNELEAGFSWSLIQRTDVSDTHDQGFPQRVESNSKLAVALSVMDECFVPIIDRRSGINMIHNVVYNRGSNFNRLNYRGFYTAILERGDEIISAASIRIHGTRLAEMPFIGTREIYRRQGMCQRLLSAIETELCSLKVEQLIIPAISEHMDTWTTTSGFHQLEDSHKKEIKSMNMLVFPGTDMLQKQLMKQEISEGADISKSITQPTLLVEKSDVDTFVGNNGQVSEDSGVCRETKTNAEIALDSSNDVKAPAYTLDYVCGSDVLISNEGTAQVKSELENEKKDHENYTHSALESSESEHVHGNDHVKAPADTSDYVSGSDVLISNKGTAEVKSEVENEEKEHENHTRSALKSSEFGHVQGNVRSTVSISEDGTGQVIVSNGGESSVTCNAEVDHNAVKSALLLSGDIQEAVTRDETDKPDGEHEMLSSDDREAVPPISTPEDAAPDTATVGSHLQSSSSADGNSTKC